ncbi:MAG: calcium/proton exchanger [Nitrospirae bacterium]|nr:calcium/proton exchanger [Nitrospirota bacterium]
MKNLLFIFIPITLLFEFIHADPLFIFISASIGIIPLAGLMGKATEAMASSSGEAIGGFLNASFGNAAELIIAAMALKGGLHDLVKASITGSIVGNLLLVMGLAIVAGGVKNKVQTFNRTAAGMGATLLFLSTVGLVIPALFHYSVKGISNPPERELSVEIAIVLFVAYLLSLLFSLKTHRHLYETGGQKDEKVPHWGWGRSISVLLGATAGVAVMSEILVSAIEPAAKSLGISELFIGVILVAIIGNAAEHSTAVLVAARNKMDLAMGIAVGSSIQIALFVAPLLIFISYIFGSPMDLIFTPFEVVAVALSVGITGFVAMDGESNWLEGVMLLAVYFILGIAFFYLP